MTLTNDVQVPQFGYAKYDIVGGAIGSIGGVPNVEGVILQIVEGWLVIDTPGATTGATLGLGIGANVDGDYSNLVSAVNINTPVAGDVLTVVGRAASEAAATTPNGQKWAVAEYLTATVKTAECAALRARLFLKFLRLSD